MDGTPVSPIHYQHRSEPESVVTSVSDVAIATKSDVGLDKSANLQKTIAIEHSLVEREPLVSFVQKEQLQGSDDLRSALLQPRPARRPLSVTTFCSAGLDLCTTILAFYFIVFGALVSFYNGTPVSSEPAPTLLRAAQYNPTIFPILFSAIVGKCIQSAAAWRLERGVPLGTIECMLGSRSVASVIATSLRLRFFNAVIPMLLILWAFSPLGSQASLRVVSSAPAYTMTNTTTSYLNSMSPFYIINALEGAYYGAAVDAVFTGALILPNEAKQLSQDQFGNVKIPLLEHLMVNGVQDASGWWTPKADTSQGFEYSSLIGLPLDFISGNNSVSGNSSFVLESMYMFPNCTLELWDLSNRTLESMWTTFYGEAATLGPDYTLALRYDVPSHNLSTMSYPRRLQFGSETQSTSPLTVTMATCDVTTTYVETEFFCQQQNCNPIGMRSSTLPHISTNVTSLDGLDTDSGSEELIAVVTLARIFFDFFINSTQAPLPGFPSALEYYFVDPGAPFSSQLSDLESLVPINSIGNTTFSYRFAQLLNTYWLAGVAPYAITGNFSAGPPREYTPQYNVSLSERTITEMRLQLHCNNAWLAILMLSSLLMLVAGVAAVVLGSGRRGPEIIDSFASLLRDTPYAHLAPASSLEDGSDKARRLRYTKVILGNVRPSDHHGYIALAVDSPTQRVERIAPKKKYL